MKEQVSDVGFKVLNALFACTVQSYPPNSSLIEQAADGLGKPLQLPCSTSQCLKHVSVYTAQCSWVAFVLCVVLALYFLSLLLHAHILWLVFCRFKYRFK